jgi:hypothetical protein
VLHKGLHSTPLSSPRAIAKVELASFRLSGICRTHTQPRLCYRGVVAWAWFSWFVSFLVWLLLLVPVLLSLLAVLGRLLCGCWLVFALVRRVRFARCWLALAARWWLVAALLARVARGSRSRLRFRWLGRCWSCRWLRVLGRSGSALGSGAVGWSLSRFGLGACGCPALFLCLELLPVPRDWAKPYSRGKGKALQHSLFSLLALTRSRCRAAVPPRGVLRSRLLGRIARETRAVPTLGALTPQCGSAPRSR